MEYMDIFKKGFDFSRLNIGFVKINPDMAKVILESNINSNRNVNAGRVAAYTRDMRNGSWGIDPDCIAISNEGHLINGQHRMRAVIASKTTQTFAVITGVPEKNIMFMDCGQPRSINQILKIMNVSDTFKNQKGTSLVRAILRVMGEYGAKSHVASTVSEVAEFEKRYSESIRRFLSISSISSSKKNKLKKSHVYCAAFAAMINGVSIENIDAFMKVGSSTITEGFSTEFALRYIDESEAKGLSFEKKVEMCKRAIYGYVNNLRRSARKEDVYPMNEFNISIFENNLRGESDEHPERI